MARKKNQSTARGLAACRLRFAGADHDDIAEALGFPSARAAAKAIEKELAAHIVTEDQVDMLRAEMGQRLMHMLDTLTPKATEPDHPEHLPAVRTAVAVIDRFNRLFALEMAPEGQTYNPTQTELEQWVDQLTAAAMPALPEADVVDVG